jgi:hypothetical protein
MPAVHMIELIDTEIAPQPLIPHWTPVTVAGRRAARTD